MEQRNKREELEAQGIYIGDRDPKRNQAFKGRYMVCEDTIIGPTDDAEVGGFCIVGDNLDQLIEETYAQFIG